MDVVAWCLRSECKKKHVNNQCGDQGRDFTMSFHTHEGIMARYAGVVERWRERLCRIRSGCMQFWRYTTTCGLEIAAA